MAKKNKKKIGLALGGGGAKGLAHIGVIRALEKYGIPIDFIAGTSMGALVGGWYALYGKISSLENLFLEIDEEEVFPIEKLIKDKKGILFSDRVVLKGIRRGFKNKKFEECLIPFAAVATDVVNGDIAVLEKGDLSGAIGASIAVPLVFKPVKIDKKILVDGGLVNPVPADVVREMGADVVIAIDVSSKWIDISSDFLQPADVYSIVSKTFSAVEHQIARPILKQADIVLRPPVMRYTWLSFGEAKDIIRCGFDETKYNLKEIQEKTGYHIQGPQTILEKVVDFVLYG